MRVAHARLSRGGLGDWTFDTFREYLSINQRIESVLRSSAPGISREVGDRVLTGS